MLEFIKNRPFFKGSVFLTTIAGDRNRIHLSRIPGYILHVAQYAFSDIDNDFTTVSGRLWFFY
ncbi:MAG: hypothetical protein A3G52_01945 [Candidatus Taylorbacteria bacterium RIFCSPLOWO2_12_FULL_43_20]|uniref:Uncharacterized protein n=1 Tax=Candidatus Taylorbacteria bacterium RIFCSPLOWO2_12_FULL_43_20 TaxID=1802332 RepID=A0A1G2P5T6_9BACT|nr:MAG: hypothetical protein A2825_02840 [Candidatus Taylorbacteria bacterium RIFCSPHIGHO2_01_FULL_43_120]OHA23014.1 MAG: hypothetical protein A3B98_01915 [Candidatus Taylorbacteria bacterium RIFCSPHIGHO2_02_FULL_43_55]OHA30130.1 MAG: hypothetical protein A3E92_00950 [Candidatus Taylorbacteria bacterium RIFCSPHIGHO2_12_FULL_42_34]OHA30728.1 MAG: hypothetical protein A3B09_01705 [Candidatus Taylorbacteria bacterium RIFCSPLOWO2_01_FULL_43_83]OHA39601.1 MAG: hypothetical protein A3H58_02390 [Candi